MPRKLTTDEEIKEAWDKKRERDKKAQARWVEANREEHKKRMREQYQKRKAKAQGKKVEEEAQAGAGEARQEVVVPVMEAPAVEAPPPPPAKECEVKEVPAGLSLLDVVKRIRNSYYASLRNKAGWKGKSEEAREQWKADFVFCDDLVAKNEDKLTPEHKAELTARGIALTDPRLIAKELDEGIFTAPIPEKKAPVRRKLRVKAEVPKEEPAPAPAPAPEPEKKEPVRRKRRLAPKPADGGMLPLIDRPFPNIPHRYLDEDEIAVIKQARVDAERTALGRGYTIVKPKKADVEFLPFGEEHYDKYYVKDLKGAVADKYMKETQERYAKQISEHHTPVLLVDPSGTHGWDMTPYLTHTYNTPHDLDNLSHPYNLVDGKWVEQSTYKTGTYNTSFRWKDMFVA